ncbi:GntR family transcriptional regulator [Micromonospora costi]|uniref:GntR family transcriptional regulator n=1 Tax=Micromonospora costi TaxID=1530042 RepID=UPI0033D526AE
MDAVPPQQPAPAAVHRNGRGRTAADEAYARLREDIVKGRLMPNQRLVEVDLTVALGVGRTAVRTVLARLEQEGLVVHEPNRGARVRMVTEAEALEITQARGALEALAAREAALHATPEEVAFLRETLTQMSACLRAGDLLAYSDGNARMHAKIIEASRHQTATRLIAGLKAQMVRFQYRTVLVPGRSARSLVEHTRIVDAIETADPDAAEAAMRHHLSHVADTLREMTSPRASPTDLVHF